MRQGRVYQRTLSREATEVFFINFQADYGDAGLQNAIDASRLHADYYESLGNGKKKAIRELCDEYEVLIMETGQATLAGILSEFEEGVSKSLRDNSSTRKERLASYDGNVSERIVTQKVFVRNYDVVAETLIRSSGKCEYCEKPAPFARGKDGHPYLEVHHRVPLAEGGKDRLENTLALCPNCHREAHFGKDTQKFRR